MNYNFPYLQDSSFLRYFDQFKIKEQYVKLNVLNFKDQPIESIQGRVTGGSISMDGSSAMRRTANLAFIADDQTSDLTHIRNLLSINKKVQVLIGFKNNTNYYTDYDMIWFPQGVFVIITPNISHSSSGLNVNLTLHDKMAFLNGECGGTLPASVVFHEIETVDEDGNLYIDHPTIYQIIQQLVHHFGGQQLGKIIISDVDTLIKKAVKWGGNQPLYLVKTGDSSTGISYTYQTEQPPEEEKAGTFYYGDDVGFVYTDFIFPKDLISKGGDTVVSILDQIKNVLGNYEYFYDVDGNFVFQQIKNYLNTSHATVMINKMTADNYLVDFNNGKAVYNFEDSDIIQAVTSAPQYQQIKNDFVVWGQRKSISGAAIPIRYHLAIDSKPKEFHTYEVFFYTDPDDGIKKAVRPQQPDELPEKGEQGLYYKVNDVIYQWRNGKWIKTDYQTKSIMANDFRTQLYLAGAASEKFALDTNYYYTELKNEWPKIFDVQTGEFYKEAVDNPSDIDFFLDFIDSQAAIDQFSVQNIGRRTKVINDTAINCVFQPTVNDYVLIEIGSPQQGDMVNACELRHQKYSQVPSTIYSKLANGGALRSAYEQIRSELYQYTSYNEQVSLTALPIYYLQPNVRISIRDTQANIYGDYMIKNLSIPLDVNGTMNISCIKALQRI